jgi:predicted dehydrogenase
VREHRVGLIGFAGHQGREYADAIQTSSGLRLVAGVDTSSEAATLATSLGISCFPTVADLIHWGEFDLAVVAVPHAEHFRLTADLLEAGKHVLKEKPFATAAREGQELYRLATASDRGVYTLTQRPQRPDVRRLGSAVRTIGDVYWFDCDYHLNLSRPTTGWRGSWRHARGGVLLDMGYHMIDVITSMFGTPTDVDASLKFRYQPSRAEHLEDLVDAHLYYPGKDLSGSVVIARHAPHRVERLTVHGTEGTLELDGRAQTLTEFDRAGQVVESSSYSTSKTEVLNYTLEDALRTVTNDQLRASHMQHHLRVVEVCDSIYRAAQHRMDHTIHRGIA